MLPLPRTIARRATLLLGPSLAFLLFASGCAAGAMPPVAPGAPPADAEAAPAPAPPPPPMAMPEALPLPGPTISAEFKKAERAAPAPAPPPAPVKAKEVPQKGPAPIKGAKVLLEPAPAPAPVPGQQAPAAPMLIYVGNLQMEVDQEAIPGSLDKVVDVAEAFGGYLAGRKDQSVEVRVPSRRFREALTLIEKGGVVLHRTVSADDVSEQLSDLGVRLSNLRATQKRLQEFLARSASMSDMLTVGRELDRVAGEIEQIEGKMRFLESRAAFSLITVAVQARPKALLQVVVKEPPRKVTLPIGWLPGVGISRLLNLGSP